MEIHYTCSPKASDMTRRPPLPPWYLQPVQKPDEGNQDTWLPNSAIQKERDIAPVINEPSGKKNFNSRIPILVATTTQPPKRIPITTPRPTTPSTTTVTPETTTTLEALTSLEEIQPNSESSQLPLDKYGKASLAQSSNSIFRIQQETSESNLFIQNQQELCQERHCNNSIFMLTFCRLGARQRR